MRLIGLFVNVFFLIFKTWFDGQKDIHVDISFHKRCFYSKMLYFFHIYIYFVIELVMFQLWILVMYVSRVEKVQVAVFQKEAMPSSRKLCSICLLHFRHLSHGDNFSAFKQETFYWTSSQEFPCHLSVAPNYIFRSFVPIEYIWKLAL